MRSSIPPRHHGYPSASLALEARSFGRLVESSIYPAFLASSPFFFSSNQAELAVLLSSPPPWWAGLAAPLPMIAAFGEGRRRFDTDALAREGARAIKALAARLKTEDGGKDGWFLGCPYVLALASALAFQLCADLIPLLLRQRTDPARLPDRRPPVCDLGHPPSGEPAPPRTRGRAGPAGLHGPAAGEAQRTGADGRDGAIEMRR